MTLTTLKWTIDDYHQMIAAGILEDRPVELLNGEIVEMSPEGEPHAYYRNEATDYLKTLLRDRAKVRQGSPITILGSNSEPEPDIAIVRPLGRVYLQHHPYPEDIFWLIESSQSSLNKDLEPKAMTYAQAGIPEYWVVNLKEMQLIVMRSPANSEYQSQITMTQGSVSPLAFPDISIVVARLLD